MTTPKIAVQARLWGLDRVAAEYAAVFDEIVAAGYAGAEVRGALLQNEEEGIRNYLQRQPGFSLLALHANLKGFEQPEAKEELPRLLERMNRVGAQYLLVSMGYEAQPDKWFELAAELSGISETYGVTFAYHNHAIEFTDGIGFFDRLTGEYKVHLAADLAWVHKAGYNVTDFIDRYEASIRYVHVKDTLGEQWKELGEGEVPLSPILERVSALQLPWWTVEQDFTDREPSQSAAISRNYLKKQFHL